MAHTKISIALYKLGSASADVAATACAEASVSGVSPAAVTVLANNITNCFPKVSDWDAPHMMSGVDSRIELIRIIAANAKKMIDTVIPHWSDDAARSEVAGRLRIQLSQLRDAVKDVEKRRLETELVGKLSTLETTFDF